jgi:hypothetical protein
MALKFRKVFIADERYESAGVFDVNGDGQLDIVSGAWWYEGPDFRRRHPVGEMAAFGEYFDDFSTIALDVNGDGRLDVVSGGWWGKELRWHENTGKADQPWPVHRIGACGNIETTRAWDVDRDGVLELVPNCPNDPLVVYKLATQGGRGAGAFTAHTIRAEKQGHGLGFGDISGSGRGDFVLADGWLEAPQRPYDQPWTWHPEFKLGMASVPVLVVDANGDGVNELIVGAAHNFGLDWLQPRRNDDGTRSWIRHPIDPWASQYHDMHWVDIDGDGACELVTGQRYRAHNGNDPGEYNPIGIYYFKWNGESFTKEVVDYGPARVGKGLGIHFAVADLTGSGRLDIVAPGKDGLYVYYNEGL